MLIPGRNPDHPPSQPVIPSNAIADTITDATTTIAAVNPRRNTTERTFSASKQTRGIETPQALHRIIHPNHEAA
jgi:transposase